MTSPMSRGLLHPLSGDFLDEDVDAPEWK